MPPQADKTKEKTETNVKEPDFAPEQAGEIAAFVDDLVDGKKPKAKAKEATAPDDEANKKAADEKAKADAAAKEETEKKKPRKVTPKPEPMTPADIAEAVARGVAEATRPKAEPEKKKDEAIDELAFLNPKEKKVVKILAQMEQDEPETYKGLSKKFADGRKAEIDYRAKWEKENPGDDFDPEAQIHSDFYAQNDVDWDDDDYSTAISRLETAKVRKEYEEKETQRETARKAEVRKLELVPAIAKEQVLTADAMLKEMGGEFAKIHKEDGSRDNELLKKLQTEDPDGEIVFRAADYATSVAAETFRLYNGLAEYDKDKPTALQQEIIDYIIEQENVILAMTKAEQVDAKTGRTFSTYQKWQAMTPEQRATHWYLDARKVNALRAVDIARDTKKIIEADNKRMDARAAKKGMTKAQRQEATEDAQAAEATRIKAEQGGGGETDSNEKPESPESAGSSGLSTRTGGKEAAPKNPEDAFVRSFIG